MWVTLKTILPVLLWVCSIGMQHVSGTGWKPIPPPPGLYISKTSFPIRGALSGHLTAEELGLDRQPEGALEDGDYRKHQKFDIFPAVEDSIYSKDGIKPFKSSIPIYEGGRKRPAISYSSFNPFPVKKPSIYIEKPGVKYFKPSKTNYLNEYKYHKTVGFSENDIAPYHPFGGKGHDERCPLYKVSFRQDLYFQYIQYKVHMPELKEFTICLWNKFHNHSYDQPLFSYAVRHQPKAIYMWVSHTERSNYYNMKINGHPIFRLNYPIRLNRWYHTCQSWNSKTGEWQVWVDSKRIGRGFHNLLVGHVIPGGGIAISGQEQLQYGGGFLEAADLPKGSGGLLGEITMFQLYRIALSAGKAYTDHRHHHSHYTSTTPEPPEIPTEEPLPTPEHPFLENGQLKKPLKVFELAESLRTKGNLDTPQNQPTFTDFYEGHFVNPYLSLGTKSHFGNGVSAIPYAEHAIFKRHEGDVVSPHGVDAEARGKVKLVMSPASGIHVEKIKYKPQEEEEQDEGDEGLPDWSEKVQRSRRSINETEPFDEYFINVDDGETRSEEDERTARGMMYGRKRPTRQNLSASGSTHSKRVAFPHENRKRHSTRNEAPDEHETRPKKVAKKHLILGNFYYQPFVGQELGYLHNHQPILTLDQLEREKEPDDNPLHASVEDSATSHQPEPAEEEVLRIMSVCSGCERDPYRKVAVISWRSTPKKLFSGALFLKARFSLTPRTSVSGKRVDKKQVFLDKDNLPEDCTKPGSRYGN